MIALKLVLIAFLMLGLVAFYLAWEDGVDLIWLACLALSLKGWMLFGNLAMRMQRVEE